MKLKLNEKTIHPKENGLYLAVNEENRFIGIILFEDGNWMVMPGKKDINHVIFQWIEYE